jgi:hypothetical protein
MRGARCSRQRGSGSKAAGVTAGIFCHCGSVAVVQRCAQPSKYAACTVHKRRLCGLGRALMAGSRSQMSLGLRSRRRFVVGPTCVFPPLKGVVRPWRPGAEDRRGCNLPVCRPSRCAGHHKKFVLAPTEHRGRMRLALYCPRCSAGASRKRVSSDDRNASTDRRAGFLRIACVSARCCRSHVAACSHTDLWRVRSIWPDGRNPRA